LSQQLKKVFIFLDTDKHASPFDILTTIDILPDAAILKYEDVTVEESASIVYDAMFPRGPDGAKHTKIFINGRDFQKVNAILEKLKSCMFPPFELAVLVDPRGAYTTASAAVAKTLQLSLDRGLGSLENKHVTILGGTGPVGQTAARLYAAEGANVLVTSRSLQKAASVATEINGEYAGEKVKGAEVKTPEEAGKALQSSEIILSAGGAGVQLLSLDTLKKYGKNCKVVADINAIPPLGVEGLDPNTDGKEVLPHISGVGSLAIGKLKNKVESDLIRKVAGEPKGIFDYKAAYELARKYATKKPAEKKTVEVEQPKYWLP
jgi:methylene-tetrahydromethanopterin dehydrogenase